MKNTLVIWNGFEVIYRVELKDIVNIVQRGDLTVINLWNDDTIKFSMYECSMYFD